ncbi:MAG TPA: alpha/beta hydrolase [Cyclobacteriaceae bacterium]|nr:alpha/beta hydrolase [Cyclobacteriaceae bacterium]HMV08788.1 alpha/beta hydrolase [Cyclobacteriaceae bacterium]HMW99934.1 alpha/beta hydrolase [Cyclobacteriaceae bacterium]HMX49203.1 alpha/beta hydrolase [Cyclobacteriaceae bacterium]HMY92755.1 alpha/beta hydrolase [Cyclobacteriaceae bacterium]
MKRILLISFSVLLVILVIVYFSGPKPDHPKFNKAFSPMDGAPVALDAYLRFKESQHKLKPNNEARIVWADSVKRKTEYAVVYLHGFSASQMEGDPVHRRFAKAFGANLYLARLSDHGIDTTETLLNFTADRFWNSAKDALAMGKAIGDKVILVTCSTGGTVGLMLAAEYPNDVYALINMSPNIAINDPAAFLLNDHWGLKIARTVLGSDYREWVPDTERAKYWNSKYRIEALVQLEELVESSMTEETFKRVKQPCLNLYYYKDEEHQDLEVKVSAMLEMHKQLGTPDSLKEAIAMPNVGAHVMGSSLTSKDVEGVYHEMERFAIEKLGMKKVE